MLVKCFLVLLSFTACVIRGHIISNTNYTMNEHQYSNTGTNNELGRVPKRELDIGQFDNKLVHERAGSKDMIYPILLGVVAKILSTIPVFLTTLALVAGFSLATSKAALLLGGVILFYHYLSEGHLLVPVTKNWKHLMPDWGAGLLGHHWHPPHYSGSAGHGYHRDRNDRHWNLQLTD